MIRPSEAIRLGAMLRPQAFGALGTFEPVHTTVMGQRITVGFIAHTCAVGAALEALGKLHVHDHGDSRQCFTKDAVEQEYWSASMSQLICPWCQQVITGKGRLTEAIAHLNDGHRWTRERIADWVATVERAESPESDSLQATVELPMELVGACV